MARPGIGWNDLTQPERDEWNEQERKWCSEEQNFFKIMFVLVLLFTCLFWGLICFVLMG